MPDDIEFQIARLELEPGDILVVKSDRKQNHEALADLIGNGVRVLYIPSDVDLSVLTKSEIDERAA